MIVSGWVDDKIAINTPNCVHAVLKKSVHVEDVMESGQQALNSK